MHIPTTALLAISFYILGRSLALGANEPHDNFVLDYYEVECSINRIYPKHRIYALARHYCTTIATHEWLRHRSDEKIGYRSSYPIETEGDEDEMLLSPDRHIVPIRKEGLFRFELELGQRRMKDKDGHDVEEEMYPGYDRLVLGDDCLILGIFVDYYYPDHKKTPKIEWCGLYSKPIPRKMPKIESPGSAVGFPEGPSKSRSRSPEGPSKSRSRSPERPSKSRFRSPERFNRVSSKPSQKSIS